MIIYFCQPLSCLHIGFDVILFVGVWIVGLFHWLVPSEKILYALLLINSNRPRLGNAFKYITVIGCAYFFFHTAYFIAAELAKVQLYSIFVSFILSQCSWYYVYYSLTLLNVIIGDIFVTGHNIFVNQLFPMCLRYDI